MQLNKFTKIAAVTVLTVASLGSLSACGGDSSGSASGKQVIINTVANATTAVTVNYNPFSSTALSGTLGGLYQALFYVNSNDPKSTFEPLIGQSQTVSADGTSVDVKLRSGVKWSDGQALTADDVVYTFGLILKNQTLNTMNIPTDTTVTKVSDTEFNITFKNPSYQMINQILTGIYIVPQHAWENIADPAKDTNEKAVSDGPLTTDGGSFTSMAYTLMWNPNFYGNADNPKHVDGIRFVVYTSTQTEQNDLIAGKLDWTNLTIQSGTNLPSAITTINTPSSMVSLITCSDASIGCQGPITDPAVRQAIFYGMDRTQLNKLAFDDQYLPINGSLYPTVEFQKFVDKTAPNTPAPMSPDAAKAEQILQDAGYTKGSDGLYQKDGQELKFKVDVTNGTSSWIDALNDINQQLKPIGIEIDMNQISSNAWTPELHNGQDPNDNSKPFVATIYGLYMPSGTEAYNFYDHWFNGAYVKGVGAGAEAQSMNYARYNNSAVNDALKTISSTNDDATKIAAYATIQQQVAKDMPYIPILRQGGTVQTYADQVTGWPTKDNLYVSNPGPQFWPDASVVLTHLQKK